MSSVPLVSIIVAVYNVEEYIERCLKSLIDQEFEDYEIIVVNDGSTDSSHEKCKKFLSNKKIRYFLKNNGGLSSVRNYGIKKARGKYILNIDGDDYISNNCLKECLSPDNLQKDPDMIWFGLDTTYENGKPYPHGTKIQHREKILNSSTVMLELSLNHLRNMSWQFFTKKEILTSIKEPVYPDGIYYEDLASTYKIVGQSQKILFVSGIYYHYIQHPGTITHSSSEKKLIDVEKTKKIIVNSMNSPLLKRNWTYSIGLQEYYMLLDSKPRDKRKLRSTGIEVLKNWPENKTNYEMLIYLMLKFHVLGFFKIIWRRVQSLNN